MAVYKIGNGKLALVAESLDNILPPALAEWEDWDGLMDATGFTLLDEVDDVYRCYRRMSSRIESVEGQLHGVAYMFDVMIDDSNMDYILLSNRLPEYLEVLRLLEPLVNRSVAMREEVKRQIREGR